MAQYLSYGQTAVRPGTYFDYGKTGNDAPAATDDGVTAVLFKSSWGPLNTPVIRTATEGYSDLFGEDGTTDAIALTIEGGSQDLVLVRVGTGGTNAKAELKTSGSSGTAAVTLTAKYVGARALTISVRDSIADDTKREAIIYDGTAVFEKVTFDKGTKEGSAFVEAMKNSSNFSASLTGTDGELAEVTQQAFTAGTDPTATVTEYSAALKALEPEVMNVIVVDTGDWSILALVSSFVTRMFNNGTNVIACVGEPATVDLDTRITHAASLNNDLVVDVLNGKGDHAIYGAIDGYQTAAKVGGMISGTSCRYSLTHTVMTNMTDLSEKLSNADIVNGETHGGLVLSKNKSGQIWVDSAVNTLVTPGKNQDAGWKKIRRTKTRLEIFTRCNATIDQMVGTVDTDENGQKAIIDAIGTVLDAMIGESKITWYNVSADPAHPASGDSCWFLINVIDKDSAEKVYLNYQYRYDTNAPAASNS